MDPEAFLSEEERTQTLITTLQKGNLAVQGEFMWGSNYTFLVEVQFVGNTLKAVYKPTRGERPLWDFPASTLAPARWRLSD
jgi:hypothetical protein